jgi:hypothetical protein
MKDGHTLMVLIVLLHQTTAHVTVLKHFFQLGSECSTTLLSACIRMFMPQSMIALGKQREKVF